MGENKKDLGEEIAGKILTAALVVAGAYLLFRAAVGGIFSLMMGGKSDNGIYVLFYGGAVVLLVVLALGAGSGWALWRRSAKKPAEAGPSSASGSGISIGLAVVAAAALLLILGFLRGFL